MNILNKFRKSIMLAVKLMIILSMTFIFIGCWQDNYEASLFSGKGNYVVVFSYLVILLAFSNLYGGLKIGMLRLHEVIYSFSLSMLFTNFIMYLELSLIARELVNPLPLLWAVFLQLIIIFFGSYAANSIYYSMYQAHHILAIVGENVDSAAVVAKMGRIKERYAIDKIIYSNEGEENIIKAINEYEAIFIGDIEKSLQNNIIRYCYKERKRIYLSPSSNDIIINNCYQSQIFDAPVLVCRNRGLTIEQQLIKRAMDLLVSVIGLIIASPIMILVALGIKLYDGGPVFFKQNRVTKDGKIFNVLKFRSMIVDADKVKLRKATTNDDRITPIGKIIRPLRLDELPQLLNILKGDMSLVGPRPERTENVYEYTQMLPEFDLRHRVKGGLTGYAQIYGKYNTSPQSKLNMDLIYIEKYSLLLDLKLLVMTIKILFMRESTEGFSDEDSLIGNKNKKTEGNKTEE
ncbi:MAG: exopolysaccharide biosynthesis polyprenyl glycosylphosphotransferase [Clostridia bacterium]|nr:exopolysaccharide biosynthesis polyprenyl glycosylphosphotransferase [Clostridia bacterium]